MAWAGTVLPDGLTVFTLPEQHRKLMRTRNAIKRVNKEIKRGYAVPQ